MSADHYSETDPEGAVTFEIAVDEALKVTYQSPHANGPQRIQGMLRAIEDVPPDEYRPDDETALWIDPAGRDGWIVVWVGRREVRKAREFDPEGPRSDRRLGDLVAMDELF